MKFDKGGCFLIPESMEFAITNTDDDYIECIHVLEPTREGFKPNDYIVLHDEDTYPMRPAVIMEILKKFCYVMKTVQHGEQINFSIVRLNSLPVNVLKK